MEDESTSPMKKGKGKPGRKPGQKTTTTESTEKDQEMDYDIGNDQRSFLLFFRMSMFFWH